ncbi:biotin--[acetyl-CoA-carboxylase] ligase [Methylocaldum sp.]|uniref:biotin--[acetyl-CoA-carboxylase] ligase n=1 Tax=Methylocaldum sp. TaxID=1969727 RepID=UPI002D629706|nr:biotin--[acetyl-CoA-carboxylase] ligase [Methylocaldum sp.]HYE36235.1 biotin--[acetyl-CoA-carboxylase] ligase [Methylocaldum sp.]
MQYDALTKTLLHLLSDNGFHSGAELASRLGISRTSVWKAVRALQRRGIEVSALPGKGYRVTHPLELLSETAIQSSLTPKAGRLLGGLHVYDELDSTNAHLMRLARDGAPSGAVCLAETQTAGKGRIGRSWISPLGANIYLSILWRFDDHSVVAGLSLAVGVALIRVLNRAGVMGVGLKWPNDLLWEDRKLGGILLEVTGEAHGGCAVIVGLGVNRYIPPAVGGGIDQAWADLDTVAGASAPSRNYLVASILGELLPLLNDFQHTGLAPYLPEWRRYHHLTGREVVIHQGHLKTSGTVVDVTSEGLLVLECKDGRRREFASGDVRLQIAG